ncbi:MAG: homocysteine biosynthesis protein, partial [Candidatus Margulisiibacteriota bacterium]
ILTYRKLIEYVHEHGVQVAAKNVDKVALGVFEPLENVALSFIMKGLDVKPINAKLQNVPLYIQSNDQFVLSSQVLSLDDSLNTHYPGEFNYGGAFLIEDLINQAELDLRVTGYPNDIYDRTEVRRTIQMDDLTHTDLTVDIHRSKAPKAYINSSENFKYSENGVIKNNLLAINFRSSGILQLIYELREHIKEIFFAGAEGHWMLTEDGSLKISGNFRKMDTLYISALSLKGFGIYLAAGLGAIIDVAHHASRIEHLVNNEERAFRIIDIATQKEVATTPLRSLKNAEFHLDQQVMKTGSLTSIYLSERIEERLLKKE